MTRQNASPRRLRLGITGRVMAISLATAVAGSVAQWVVTPIMLREHYDARFRESADRTVTRLAERVSHTISHDELAGLPALATSSASLIPGGQVVIYDAAGQMIAASDQRPETLGRAQEWRLTADQNVISIRGSTQIAAAPVVVDGERAGAVVVVMQRRNIFGIWSDVLWRNALVLGLLVSVLSFFLLPLTRRALAPVTRLERQIRSRDAADAGSLSEDTDDALLKPLLTAVDEVHARSEAALKRALRISYSDPLTGLPNRARFLSKVEEMLACDGAKASFLVIDLDSFRRINTEHGPRVADLVLEEVSRRVVAELRQARPNGAIVGRLGADQFGVLVVDEPPDAVDVLAQAICSAIAATIALDDIAVVTTASIGIAEWPGLASSAGELFRHADLALKDAKRQTTTRTCRFQARMLANLTSRSQLEREIREGVARGEFVAAFQPKVNLATGEIVGAEALARWRRPDGRAVSPGVFVPIAEELGLIGELGAHILRDACTAAARWHRNGHDCRIAVNVAPQQFSDNGFHDRVSDLLSVTGLPPNMLELEITESSAIADPDRVARVMWPLRNRGVRLAIDDFGTGHSNFSSITRLPFDVFKIDQQFVRALGRETNAAAVIEMFLAMAEALNLETVAEGVETREQAHFLRQRACSVGQGYFFSPPLPASEFDAFLRLWRAKPLETQTLGAASRAA